MTEFQISETVESLEGQHVALKLRIAQAVEQASKGENDGAEIPELTREAAVLAGRIDEAKVTRQHADNAQRRRDQEQAGRDLVVARAGCLEQREAFLSHYRGACIALALYLEAQETACQLTNKTATNFGVLPAEMAALRELDLGDKPRETLSGLTPDTGSGWKMAFPVTPMHDKFTR